MKNIYISLLVIIFSISTINAEEPKCDTKLSKLKPACNIGKAMKGLKKNSENHKTIEEQLKGTEERKAKIAERNERKKNKKKFNLREFSERHQTIGQSLGLAKDK